MLDAQTFAACESRLGTTLRGKWTLDKLIGVGSMAAVYVGVHKIGKREAIKVLHGSIARSPDLTARFEQEAKAVNRFNHPGAVEIRDIDVTEDGCPFLVMELLDGEDLGRRAGRLNGLPEPQLLAYVDELLDVLSAAHAQGIIHRDIKLENLFITTEGKLKVLDFGIARMSRGPALTLQGARLGTTSYMAPEQVRGDQVDGRADVFSVGALMFRILAKRRVHEAATEAELVLKMSRDAAPSLASVAPQVSADVALVVDRALEFKAQDRYPSAATMQQDVRAIRERKRPAFAVARLSERQPQIGLGGLPQRPGVESTMPSAGIEAVVAAARQPAPNVQLLATIPSAGLAVPAADSREVITIKEGPPPGVEATLTGQPPSSIVHSKGVVAGKVAMPQPQPKPQPAPVPARVAPTQGPITPAPTKPQAAQQKPSPKFTTAPSPGAEAAAAMRKHEAPLIPVVVPPPPPQVERGTVANITKRGVSTKLVVIVALVSLLIGSIGFYVFVLYARADADDKAKKKDAPASASPSSKPAPKK